MPTPRRKNQRPKRVEVFWSDAESDEDWEDLRQTRESPTKEVSTMGYLVIDRPHEIVLARSLGRSDDDTEGRLTIPRAWIEKITTL